MPAIPIPAPSDPNRVSVERGAPSAARSGEMYNAGGLAEVGAGLQQLGAAVTGLLAKQKAARDDESVTTALLNSSYQKRNNDLTINYPDKSGAGLVEAGQEDYMKFVEEKTKEYAATGASAATSGRVRRDVLPRPALDALHATPATSSVRSGAAHRLRACRARTRQPGRL